MPPRELSAAKCSREYADGYFAAWRGERRDSPYYNRAQTERYKRGYDQAEMEGALHNTPASIPAPALSQESMPLLALGFLGFIGVLVLLSFLGSQA